ncbi:Os02g0663200 [Oryza sativa Japonica Group]|uniref:Os02g0663200 protein n=1 Tax=Oryza sativa subsp. japonica TaxID=39947 RepID=A0A0P0VN07_ORYSJ|nr:hypothetical protein EE612_012851 [Oryza sativa]BAS80157.1 Os02g0663200 [Oryza sativa Japonica Group]
MYAGSCGATNFIKKCLSCREVCKLQHGRQVGERLVGRELEGNVERRGDAGDAMVAVSECEEEGLPEVGGGAEEGLPKRGELLIEPRQYLARADGIASLGCLCRRCQFVQQLLLRGLRSRRLHRPANRWRRRLELERNRGM